MEGNYVVTIQEMLTKEIVVNASEIEGDSMEAARDFVEKKWKNGDIVLGGDDFFDVSFKVGLQPDDL